jgi:hypothetical protein
MTPDFEKAARLALSRLVLARAAMRSTLKSGDNISIEGWLSAAEDNRWIEEIKEAMGIKVEE